MQYHIMDNHPDCDGVAIVDDNDVVESCQKDMAAAETHMAELTARDAMSTNPMQTNSAAYELQIRTLTHADMEVRANGDGRTIYGVLVPFDRESPIPGGSGRREIFRRGAFARSINAGPSRVKLFVNHGHLRGQEPIGVATSLVEENRQLVGEFRIANTPDGNDALQKIEAGVFDAFSIGFTDVAAKSIRSKNVVERTEVKLVETSVCAYGQIDGASIMGIRAALFPELTPEVLERLLALEPLLALATRLDTQLSELAVGTSEIDPSTRTDDSALGHSSTATDALPAPLPNDRSPAARKRLARQIEMFHANIRKTT
jgi:HK97 family phage prohead protease